MATKDELLFHPEADEEVDAAVDWYDAQREGLGAKDPLPYLVREDLVVVLAVAHVRRRPGYWFKRAEVLRRP